MKHRGATLGLALSVAFGSMLGASDVRAVTMIDRGEISGTLTLEKSPYLVKGKIVVPYGKRLVIEPGVLVGFYPVDPYVALDKRVLGTGRLVVEGSLQAIGTAEAPIVFTSTRDPDYKSRLEPDARSSALPWGWIEILGLPRKDVRGHVHYDAQWLTEEEQLEYHFASVGEHGQVAKHRPADYGLEEEDAVRIRKLAEKMGHPVEGHGGHASPVAAADSAAGPEPDTTSVMAHCIVRYAGYHWSVNIYNTMTIRNCSFTGNISSPIGVFWGRPLIQNSDIFQNHSHGIMILQGGSAVIEGNRIWENTGIGIDAHFAPRVEIRDNLIARHETAINDPSGTTVIENNALVQNQFGIQNPKTFFFIQAAGNYWGDPSGPFDDEDDRAVGGDYSPEGKGCGVKGQVLYRPFLVASPVDLSPVPEP